MASSTAIDIWAGVNNPTTRPANPHIRKRLGTTAIYRAEYYALMDAVQRCHNPKNKNYRWYGARGLAVCDLWRFGDEETRGFDLFLRHVGSRPSPELTLDRIDNDKGYEPGNCRWATRLEQGRNRRHPPSDRVRLATINGVTKTAAQWCRETGINYVTAITRMNNGWDHEAAVTTPPGSPRP